MNGTPLVGGEVFGVDCRVLERVTFGDFIVVLVLVDVVVENESDTFLFERPFVEGELGASWRGREVEEELLRLSSSLSFLSSAAAMSLVAPFALRRE